MKRTGIIYLLLTLLLTVSVSAKAQKETIYLKSSNFTNLLVEKWISEYKKINPQVDIRIAGKDVSPQDISAELVISDEIEKTLSSNQSVSYVGQYALLPVTSANNPSLAQLASKRLGNKELKNLFFEKDIFDDSKAKDIDVTVYSGNNVNSVARTFAAHFGYSTSKFKGKKISGDDIYLLSAIQRDNKGVTFNNLNYIFDIETRRLKNDLVVLPLDLKREQREVLAETNIDKLITLLESEKVDLIPVESIGLVYKKDNSDIKQFLTWVLSDGQTFNHTYGFLNPDKKLLTNQLKELEGSLLTSNE